MENNVVLEVKNFYKKYKGNREYSVSNLNFTVKKGQFHGFIGANGAGKTTTIKAIVGAYSVFKGEIEILGYKNNTILAKKKLGYIPENTRFPKGLNTFQFIYYLSMISGLSPREAKAHTNKVLNDINLSRLSRRNPNSFSSGQKRKVLLAQALVHDPDLIVMDEPAANLDPKAREEFFQTLKNLQKKGKSIFISSHILTELESYVDSITILDGGKVVYTGDVDNIRYINEYEYKVKISKQEILKTFADRNSLELSGDKINFENQKMAEKFLEFAIKNGAKIIMFNQYKKSLNDIYNEKVKIGSMQTAKKKGKK